MNTWQQLVKEFEILKSRVARLEAEKFEKFSNPKPPMAVSEEPVEPVVRRGRPRKSEETQ